VNRCCSFDDDDELADETYGEKSTFEMLTDYNEVELIKYKEHASLKKKESYDNNSTLDDMQSIENAEEMGDINYFENFFTTNNDNKTESDHNSNNKKSSLSRRVSVQSINKLEYGGTKAVSTLIFE
jgi:hypothetical protein